MAMMATILALLSRFPYIIGYQRACIPNTEFIVDGRICFCNNLGRWSAASCHLPERRQICNPGEITWQGCRQCICKSNGQLSCTDSACYQIPDIENINSLNPWCTAFRSYYVNCSLCICPASGRIIEAHCAKDASCSLKTQLLMTDVATKTIPCIPKVMYLFPCLHCMCSDEGFFIQGKCVETCQMIHMNSSQKCNPQSFFRRDCNVCQCPSNSIPDASLCTKQICKEPAHFKNLPKLKSKSFKCVPHKFIKPRCFYCDCSINGELDENACLELECLKDFKYDSLQYTCNVGESVPICMQCLCLRNGQTDDRYCSKTCSYEGKLEVIENIMNSTTETNLVDKDAITKSTASARCEPNSIYIDQGKYCLCPENGVTDFNFCSSFKERQVSTPKKSRYKINIDFDIICEPKTFVEFDCNSCFCNKTGRIDSKWCTYDDCDAKRVIQQAHDLYTPPTPEISENCNSGSISKVDCNFCICLDNGLTKDRVCTKNDCSSFATAPPSYDKFICEPLAYYEVDCNICFCPKDGLKNVAKCTKNHCEKSFLRSDVCVPGQLFSYECNVCVCPPNGNKSEKACTNYTCSGSTPWKKIFQLSESLLGNQVAENDATRNLELCFPGEEFILGSELCVCPDMGLKVYATCSPTCEDKKSHSGNGSSRRMAEECDLRDIEFGSEDQCTPGGTYISSCKECICSHINGSKFCRSIPENLCVQPKSPKIKPGIFHNSSSSLNKKTEPHSHTKYSCTNPGRVMDRCFICECQDNVGKTFIIEEHCFRSDAVDCAKETVTFLEEDNKIH